MHSFLAQTLSAITYVYVAFFNSCGNLQSSECAMDHSVVMDLVFNFQAEFRILVHNCFCSWQRIEMLFGLLIRTDEAG